MIRKTAQVLHVPLGILGRFVDLLTYKLMFEAFRPVILMQQIAANMSCSYYLTVLERSTCLINAASRNDVMKLIQKQKFPQSL